LFFDYLAYKNIITKIRRGQVKLAPAFASKNLKIN